MIRVERDEIASLGLEVISPASLKGVATGAIESGTQGRWLLLKTASRFMNKPYHRLQW
jgi:hypothetical protein